MTFIIFFILGLIIGSFLNVVVYRLNLAETILGRSYCPNCKTQIRWHDNIPLISFALLKAKCRDCGEKISWQYPFVEFLTGILLGLTGQYFFMANDSQTWMVTLFYAVLFSILMVIFLYDLKFMEVPMLVLWTGVAWVIGFFIFLKLGNHDLDSFFLIPDFTSKLLGGAIAFLFFYSLSYFSKETWMGYGDAYVGLLIGLVAGLGKILPILTLSFAIGAVFSIGLILFKKKSMKSQIPFAPFLVIGTVLGIFLYEIYPQISYFI